jgi:hydroxypyruvate isomerase
MPKFAANLTLMYNEHAFPERFAAAAADGFEAVEYLFPYPYAAAELKRRLEAHGLAQVLFNAPPGDWEAGDRGIAALPEREDEFKRSIDLALDYARVLGNRRLHVMAGALKPGRERSRCRASYVKNLAYAASQAASIGVTVLIEPINTRDMPGYFLNRQDEAHAICKEVGAQNLKMQFDMYHCQIVEGDLAAKMRLYLDDIAHMQIAGVPDRNEPDGGEVNYPYLFALMDELGYGGWVGCEYRPRAGTSQGLGWLKSWLRLR